MSGIPALEAEGEIYFIDCGKAQALNAQFVCVFTQPDSTSLPDKGPSLYQDIPDLDIGLQGIVNQLAHLKVTKAGGPDDVPAWVLHDYVEDLGPMLTCNHMGTALYPRIGERSWSLEYTRRARSHLLKITGL